MLLRETCPLSSQEMPVVAQDVGAMHGLMRHRGVQRANQRSDRRLRRRLKKRKYAIGV